MKRAGASFNPQQHYFSSSRPESSRTAISLHPYTMNPRVQNCKVRVKSWLASLPSSPEADSAIDHEEPRAKRARRDTDLAGHDTCIYPYNISPPLTMNDDNQIAANAPRTPRKEGRKRAADAMDVDKRPGGMDVDERESGTGHLLLPHPSWSSDTDIPCINLENQIVSRPLDLETRADGSILPLPRNPAPESPIRY